MYKKFFKRAIDICFSGFALVVFLPVLIILAIVVRLKLGSPVLFKQKRPGKNGKIFTMHKFRTMTNERDENGDLLSDSKRLTKFGRFLRSTSLDELPELWDIFRGKMSIIGPRPLLVEYLPYYNEREKMRHDVRPGLTGYAQINGRSVLAWEKRLELDAVYVEKLYFKTDLKIFFATIKKVIKREDAFDKDETRLLYFDEHRRRQQRQIERAEIGGEFCLDEKTNGNYGFLNKFPNNILVFTGRTAIDIIAKEFLKKNITSVLIPDYACDSMFMPFKDNGIDCIFYRIDFTGGNFSFSMPEKKAQSILVCDYFSFNSQFYNEITRFAKESGMLIVHDITHSILSDNLDLSGDDYYFASLRKWMGIPCGGIVGSAKESIACELDLPDQLFLDTKLKAMRLKADYLAGKNVDKEEYLALFKDAELLLSTNYKNAAISAEARQVVENIDYEEIKRVRSNNYKTLFDGIKDNSDIEILSSYDVPFALSVYFPNTEIRDKVRAELINQRIYLPVHWPDCESSLKNRELTLIIDQRYTDRDMLKMVAAFNRALKDIDAC